MLRICAAIVLALLPLSASAGLTGQVVVIDADTWIIQGEWVRIFGIDAPEMDQTCTDRHGKGWACGVWAADWARESYGARQALCERLTTDRYGRTVARCLVDDKDVAREMVASGIAWAYRRYSFDYVSDENQAVVTARGLHAGQAQLPSQFRAARRAAARGDVAGPGGDCAIKGNISASGERIYHLPRQTFYSRTRISPAKGERWFCTEADARSAGWRKAHR